jgi:hypothetical protein
MKTIPLLVLLTLLMASCFVEIDEWFDEQNSNIPAVECYFCPQEIFSLSLYNTNNMADTTARTPITDALVKLFENGVLIDTLVHIQECNYATLNGTKPKVGHRYSIEITVPQGGVLTASDSIPLPPNITFEGVTPDAYFFEGIPYAKQSFSIYDQLHTENFYDIELLFQSEGMEGYRPAGLASNSYIFKNEVYYPQISVMQNSVFNHLPFRNESFKEQAESIDILYLTAMIQFGGDPRIYQPSHQLVTKISSISKDLYRFKTSLMIQIENREGNSLFGLIEPMNVYTNIDGGVGIFTGYNSVSDTVYVQSAPDYK